METISKIQVIQSASGWMTVRYYNEIKDRFEKVYSAGSVLHSGNVLIIGDRIYYEYQDRLYFVGYKADLEKMIQDTFYTNSVLYALRVGKKGRSMPFKALLIDGDVMFGKATPVLSFKKVDDAVEACLLNGKKVRMYYEHDYDEAGHIENVYLAQEELSS